MRWYQVRNWAVRRKMFSASLRRSSQRYSCVSQTKWNFSWATRLGKAQWSWAKRGLSVICITNRNVNQMCQKSVLFRTKTSLSLENLVYSKGKIIIPMTSEAFAAIHTHAQAWLTRPVRMVFLLLSSTHSQKKRGEMWNEKRKINELSGRLLIAPEELPRKASTWGGWKCGRFAPTVAWWRRVHQFSASRGVLMCK